MTISTAIHNPQTHTDPLLKKGHNPYAGYAYLTKKSAEEEAAIQVSRKAEVKGLYKRRILNQQGT